MSASRISPSMNLLFLKHTKSKPSCRINSKCTTYLVSIVVAIIMQRVLTNYVYDKGQNRAHKSKHHQYPSCSSIATNQIFSPILYTRIKTGFDQNLVDCSIFQISLFLFFGSSTQKDKNSGN